MPDDAETDAFYRARLLRDYDRLITEFTEALGRCGKEMVMYFTYEQLQLIGGALRSAREQAATKRVNASDIDPIKLAEKVAGAQHGHDSLGPTGLVVHLTAAERDVIVAALGGRCAI